MSNYRGQDGLLVLGGELQGTARAGSAYVTSVSEIAVTGGGSTLTGVVMVGDIFTIASGTAYTVTGAFYDVTANAIATLAFTPVIATAVASNATITFQSNSLAELTVWSLDTSIDLIEDTVKGDKHKTYLGGIASWSGSAGAYLDYDDTEQASLIDEIAAGTPDGTVAALMLRVNTGKFFYGAAELSNFAVTSPEGSALVTVTFNFQGSGQLYTDWV
jgi:hypothetical protein